MYMALSGKELDDIIRPELMDYYLNHDKVKFLSTSEYHNRTPGLFKDEFKGTKMIALTSKWYYTEKVKWKPDVIARVSARNKIPCHGIDIQTL